MMNELEIISYFANTVFITWGVVSFLKERAHRKQIANFFNSAYEMADDLSNSLKDGHAKTQAKNIVSFLEAAARNFMDRRVDKVGGESHNFIIRFFSDWFFKDKRK